MKEKMKRGLTLMLVLLMIISVIPTRTYAEEADKTEEKGGLELSPETPQNGVGAAAVNPKGTPGPNWDLEGTQEGQNIGGDLWSLPQGVRIVYGQGGVDPLSVYGANYRYHFTTDDNRVAVRGTIRFQQEVDSSVWKDFVVKVPDALDAKIDWSSSYVTYWTNSNWNAEIMKFTDGAERNTKTFPFRTAGGSHSTIEWTLVMKSQDTDGKAITWENDFKGSSQIIQFRLFDKERGRIFATARPNRRNDTTKYTLNNYNAYTKAAIIKDNGLGIPKDWIKSPIDSSSDYMWVADSMLQLDKKEGKVRVIYLKSRSDGTVPFKEFGIRQTFDREFVKYMNLKDKENPLVKITTFNQKEKGAYETVNLYSYDINGVKKNGNDVYLDEDGNPEFNRTDGATFIQVVTNGFDMSENDKLDTSNGNKIKAVRLGTGANESGRINSWTATSNEADITVFEYNIDPSKINDDLIKDRKFAQNFFFDTRIIEDESMGWRKFTAKLTEDLVIPADQKCYFKFSITPFQSIDGGTLRQDLMLNIGGPNKFEESWSGNNFNFQVTGIGARKKTTYYIPVYKNRVSAGTVKPGAGFRFKKGEEITAWVTDQVKNVGNINKIDLEVVKGDAAGIAAINRKVNEIPNSTIPGSTITLLPEEGMVHKIRYIDNTVSSIGGTATRLMYLPLVNEIFTDGKDINGNAVDSFTGYNRYSEGSVSSEVFAKNTGELDTTPAKARIGTYRFDSESDKDGNVSYYAAEGLTNDFDKIEGAALDEHINKSIKLHNKTFEGYKFKIKTQYYKDNINTAPGTVEGLELKKDMPIVFRAGGPTSLDSDSVIEQVQAKITFDTLEVDPDSGQSKTITKIAPLNKEYRTFPVTDKAKSQIAGAINPFYKESGFGGENLRIDADKPTVEVDGKTYPNFLNHNQEVYDLSQEDQKAAFMMRQWPEVPDKDGEKILGWTTVKLEKDSEGTVLQKFNKLKNMDNQSGYVRNIKDWERAEENAMIFDINSPIDKHRTVYAVRGKGYTIKLHTNINPLTDTEEEVTLLPDSKNKVQIPVVFGETGLQSKGFKQDKHTFVGWTKTKDEPIKTTSKEVVPDGRLFEEYSFDLETESGPLAVKSRKYDSITVDASALDGVTDLYARYVPYITVTATKKWKEVEAKTGATVAAKVGLLYRTAVGRPGHEVIHETAATYYPYDGPEMYVNGELKKFLYKSDNSGTSEVEWELPGFNEKGERISYIAIEFDGNKASYQSGDSAEAQFKAFSSNWNMYGISIHPTNTGTAMAKEQNLALKREGAETDAFTGATFRTHNNEDNQFKGYSISITNTRKTLSDPNLESVYAKETAIKVTVNSAGKPEEVKTKVILPGSKTYYVTYDKASSAYKVVNSANSETNEVTVKANEDRQDSFILSYPEGRSFKKGDHVIVLNLKTGVESNLIIKTVLDQPTSNSPAKPVQDVREEESENVIITSNLSPESMSNPDAAKFTLKGPEGIINGDGGQAIEGEYDKVTGNISFTVPENKLKHNEEITVQVTEPGKQTGSSKPLTIDLKGPVMVNANYKIENKRVVVTADFKDKDYREVDTAYIKVGDNYYRTFVNSNGKLTANIEDIVDPEPASVLIVAFDKLNNMSTTEVSKTIRAEIAGLVEPFANSNMVIYYEKFGSNVPVTIEVFRDNDRLISKVERYRGNQLNPRVISFLNIRFKSGDILVATPAKGQANEGQSYRIVVK